ncbi:MAG TPA: glycosyltransferase family 39 protein, partial [Actinomycetota bacterium]|nr:glycosyltransferase family 39 protein [Actinomycetota bacterium]
MRPPPAPELPPEPLVVPPPEQPAVRRTSRRVIAGMILIAVIATVQAALTGAPTPRGLGFDERRYEQWAGNLYHLGFYGDTATSSLAREELRSVPYTTYLPPGYPFYLVALKSIHQDNATTRRGLQAAMVGLTVFLIGLMALRLFGPVAGLLSEALLVATAVLATYAQFTLSETLSTTTLVGALALTMFGLRRRSWRMLLAAGAILGYSILVRPQILLLPVAIAVYIFFALGRKKRALALAAIFLVASYGVVAPWTVRNYLRVHTFVPVASYTWFNFWEVNSPLANGHFILPERSIPETTRQIRSLNEIQQDSAWRTLALTWVHSHPLKAIKGWVRDAAFYGYTRDPWVSNWDTLHGWHPPRLDERLMYPFVFVSMVLVMFVRRRRWE